MHSALDEYGIDQITEIINYAYKSDHMSEDFTKCIFVSLPKRSGANEFDLTSTISSMGPKKQTNIANPDE